MDWQGLSAAELGRRIGAGQADPVEVTEAMLAAIDAHPHGASIYARTTPDRARAEAQAARRRAADGVRRGPLDGVPISWKDLYDTAGTATESGSRLLAGRVPERDAQVLANATAQGLVCLGKTHQTELAFSGLGLNPQTASPPCINDPEAVSGGSSSGAATSVAFGLAAAGIGSDTGGSVRVPAAWNDLVGLKTTAGRLSNEGVVPLAPLFDTVGPLTRTVEDAALLLAVMEGGRPADLAGATLSGVRLMALDTLAVSGLRDGIDTAWQAAIDRLAAAGARVEHAESAEVAEAMDLAGILYTSEAYAIWGAAIEADPDAMFPPVRERFRAGKAHSAVDYLRAWARLDALRAAWAAATAPFDAVIVPTVALNPPKRAALEADHDLFTQENLLALRNTRIGNLMGGAVLTVPAGAPSVGLSLMGPPGSEERMLRLGAAASAALT